MLNKANQWFESKDWKPFRFQKQVWNAYLKGQSGLIYAPTGIGKTYAAWLGPLLEYNQENHSEKSKKRNPELRVLWITPLRALAKDTVQSLEEPAAALCPDWKIELRSGDVSSSIKRRQRDRLPTTLVTTPESMSLLLSYPNMQERFQNLQCVVVDEWHALLGNKRGVQTELCLARLKQWFPGLRIWGLSATLGDPQLALQVLLGRDLHEKDCLISGLRPKRTQISTLIPKSMERFPWAGHLGIKLLPQVIEKIEANQSTLLFTNTRSQTEMWYQALLDARPDWAGRLALHHGSIDSKMRQWIETELRHGNLLCVVCTASLDLGVDYSPVDQVIQLGSPKGIARLLQRAGRSGHRPGGISQLLCVPTNAFELIEFHAAKQSLKSQNIEKPIPLEKPYDVLAQHVVTLALGDGIQPEDLYDEIRTTYSYRKLEQAEWNWVLDFVRSGGPTLKQYPQFNRVIRVNGVYKVESKPIVRQHRMSIGTITSDQHMWVQYRNGTKLGSVEESFLAKLKPGSRFVFAGKTLELIQVRDMKAVVKSSSASGGVVPRWMGGTMPLSTQLADAVRQTLESFQHNASLSPELKAVQPVLFAQQAHSIIPKQDEFLVEQLHTRDGHHMFFYPFEGRLVHEGLSSLIAFRLTQVKARSISIMANDYGFELLSPTPYGMSDLELHQLFATEQLREDILQCLNSTEMAKRQFRPIARIAGLIFQGYPGQQKQTRHLQASSELIFDVFRKYDPDNLLLSQAYHEVLEQQLEFKRLEATLQRIHRQTLCRTVIQRLTPLAFPIWAERIRNHVSSESWSDRVKRMAEQLEKEQSKAETK